MLLVLTEAVPQDRKTALFSRNMDVESFISSLDTGNGGREYGAETNHIVQNVKREDTYWSLTLYNGMNCEGDYYFVEGSNLKDPAKCLDLIGGIDSDPTDSGVICRYFTNGGFSSVACKNSMLLPIYSWILKGGDCLTSENNCTDRGVPNKVMKPKPKDEPQCQPNNEGTYFNVESLICLPH